jgi:hypothetical protein
LLPDTDLIAFWGLPEGTPGIYADNDLNLGNNCRLSRKSDILNIHPRDNRNIRRCTEEVPWDSDVAIEGRNSPCLSVVYPWLAMRN